MIFNHFIITRFNLRLWSKDKHNAPVRTENWLSKRFELFENYCFPSIKAQTNQNFKWICLFDYETPLKYKERINGLNIEYPQFCPYFLDINESNDVVHYLKKIIRGFLVNENEFIITTRIDNDDAFHVDMINEIQKKVLFERDWNTIYCFDYGLQYFKELNFAMKISYPNNHFISYVEKSSDEFYTIMNFNHYFVNKEVRVVNLRNLDKPMWIEVIHESNVDNDVKLTFSLKPVIQNTKLDNYGIQQSINAKSSLFNFIFKIIPRILKQIFRRMPSKIRSIFNKNQL